MCGRERGVGEKKEMEESQEILLNSLAKSGVAIPADVSRIVDLTPSMLISICINAVHLLDPTTPLPALLPAGELLISDRFKLSSDLASAIKTLGFIGDISFHNFLYPSEEDLYKLVRFLVEKLPGPGEAQKAVDENNISSSGARKEECEVVSPKGRTNEDGDEGHYLQTGKSVLSEGDDDVDVSTASEGDSLKKGQGLTGQLEDLKLHNTRGEGRGTSGNKQHGPGYQQNIGSSLEHSFEINRKIGRLRCEEELLRTELNRRSAEQRDLQDEHDLLKSVVEMAFNDRHSSDLNITQLHDQIEARRKNIVEMESQWGATSASLEETRKRLEEDVAAKSPRAFEKLGQLNRVKLEAESVLVETREREEELSKLSAGLENQPRVAPRRSYIERIKEITKNTRKQDTDIERILRETRELQLESNMIQERLNRTYMVVDEMVFREAKKDPVIQQAYRLLTAIHGNFEQIADEILATDRTRREVVDYEAKLATVTSRSLNLDKLKLDLEAIRKENDFLEQQRVPNV